MSTDRYQQIQDLRAPRTARSEFRSSVKHLNVIKPEPANFCAECDDTDPPLLAMLVWSAAALIAWAVFGWSVVELARSFMGFAP